MPNNDNSLNQPRILYCKIAILVTRHQILQRHFVDGAKFDNSLDYPLKNHPNNPIQDLNRSEWHKDIHDDTACGIYTEINRFRYTILHFMRRRNLLIWKDS